MGLTVEPHESDELTGTSHLTVAYGKGAVETPFRFVNNNDLNAKSRLGALTGVTVGGRPFFCEVPINPSKLQSILTSNDALARSRLAIERFLGLASPTAFRVVYPKLTQPALKQIAQNPALLTKVAAFLADLTTEVKPDAWAIQFPILRDGRWGAFQAAGAPPIVPVAEIRDEKQVVAALAEVPAANFTPVPFLGFSFATYGRSRLSHEYILQARPKLYERGMGVMVVGAPRYLSAWEGDGRDLSALHYSSFLIADVVAEMYHAGGAGATTHVARVFERRELEVPPINSKHDASEHFSEATLFEGDPKLVELFVRTMEASNTAEDWAKGRPSAVCRLHEVVSSGEEYGSMRNSLVKGDLVDYRERKKRLVAWQEQEKHSTG